MIRLVKPIGDDERIWGQLYVASCEACQWDDTFTPHQIPHTCPECGEPIEGDADE